jgi:hypothetical protein
LAYPLGLRKIIIQSIKLKNGLGIYVSKTAVLNFKRNIKFWCINVLITAERILLLLSKKKTRVRDRRVIAKRHQHKARVECFINTQEKLFPREEKAKLWSVHMASLE